MIILRVVRMVLIPAVMIFGVLLIVGLSGCGAAPHLSSPDIATPTGVPEVVLSEADEELVINLIVCYEANEVLWAGTKGIMELGLPEGSDITPADMRPFMVAAVLESPEEFRRDGLATLEQWCSEMGSRGW